MVLMVICVAGCAGAPSDAPLRSSGETAASRDVAVTPANIRRLRSDFPAGYEVADVSGGRSPADYWGFGGPWTADPPQCAALADPVAGDAPPQGLSGSGAGGIVYAVVAASSPPPVLDQGVVADCPQWSASGGRTTATVESAVTPHIDGVPTVGMTTATRTVVEGGTQTQAQIHTATAYLGDYLAFVVVINDPGSTSPSLPPDFAATLLVKAVATLRG
jgi:hypothetical protein